MNQFICYPKCSTCKNAQKYLDEHNVEYEFRDIKEDRLNVEELTHIYEMSGLPLKRFFNTSGLLYKEHNLKEKLPTMSEKEQLELLSTNGMLVKRPIFVKGNTVLVGFKEDAYSKII